MEEIFSFERASSSKECGGNGKKDTPVPMPNTVVKLLNAESSWWETACEDRKLPRELRVRRKSGSFFASLKTFLTISADFLVLLLHNCYSG